MTDPTTPPARPALPDRLSIDPASPHHLRAVFFGAASDFGGNRRENE